MSREPITVLIVDDSFFMRTVLRSILEQEADISVVGEARNAEEAVEKSYELQPDVITMDYAMPGKNGDEAVREILAEFDEDPPRVLMISAYTENGVEQTFACLRAGAVDYIQKPSGEVSPNMLRLKQEICTKVRLAAKARVVHHRPAHSRRRRSKIHLTGSVDTCVVIGASTGGPPVIEQIISSLPETIAINILVVQHMPAYFTGQFARRLDKLTNLSITEAVDKDNLLGSHVYIAPGDADLEILPRKNELAIFHIYPPKTSHGIHPSIDVTMKSVANLFDTQAIGIILTGMGSDGLEGARAIHRHGGTVIAQDPGTAVVDSMPRTVIEAGLADMVLPPEEIAKKIQTMV